MSKDISPETDFIRHVFDAIPSYVFAVDEAFKIIERNTAAADLVGENNDLILSRRFGEPFHCLNASAGGCGHSTGCQSCVIRSSVSEAIDGGKVVRRRTKMSLQKDGATKEVYMLVSASPFVYKSKPLVLLVLEDVTQVAELQYLIPICAKCKKVRSDKDYWTRLETYCRENLGAEFTHGYCPDCFKEELEAVEKYAQKKKSESRSQNQESKKQKPED